MDKEIKINILENEIRMYAMYIPDLKSKINAERKRNRDWSVTAIQGYEESIQKYEYLTQILKQELEKLKEKGDDDLSMQ